MRKMLKSVGLMLLAVGAVVAGSAQAQTTVRYLHTDALGTVVAKTDASGNVIERTTFEPYGAVVGGEVADGPGYTGHVSDAATGLSYMQQRYYDPGVGLFLSVDPVTADGKSGHNFNRYSYTYNNPYKFTDPDGRIGKLVVEIIKRVLPKALPKAAPKTAPRQSPHQQRPQQEPTQQKKGDGPESNNGDAKKHGGDAHNDAIDNRVAELKQDSSVTDIRKNQQQVDVNGKKVGTNRPDVQYNKDGCHNCVEYDTKPANGARHQQVIRNNDPNTGIEIKEVP